MARRGETVDIQAGDYPAQRIAPDATKADGSGVVSFRPAPGANVTVEGIVVEPGAAHISFEGLTLTGVWEAGPGDGGTPAMDVAFRRVQAVSFYIMNAIGVRVIGGSYGPAVNGQAQIKVYNPQDQYAPSDILIQGVHFHDFTRTPERHTECLQVYAAAGVTIRGNWFSNCDGTGSLSVVRLFDAPVRDVLVENNFFQTGDGLDEPFYDLNTNLCANNIVIRYNSFTKGLAINECSWAFSGRMTIVGNYGMMSRYSVCDRSTVTYVSNVWVGRDAGRCGATDRIAPRLQFVDLRGKDLHLLATAAAVDAGSPDNLPRLDIDGTLRPLGTRPDAGADEYIPTRPVARCKKGVKSTKQRPCR